MAVFQDILLGNPRNSQHQPDPVALAEELDNATGTITVSQFFASTDTFNAGTVIQVRGGFTYQAVTSGGHVQNAGGQHFNVIPRNGGFWIEAFNASNAGTVDAAPAIRLAEAAARTATFPAKVLAGEGNFLINSTVTFTDVSLRGAGRKLTNFRSGITDGSAVLYWHGDSNDFSLEGFEVDCKPNLNFANYLAGTEDAGNCIGIKMGEASGTPNAATRGLIVDVGVANGATGWDIFGFIFRGLNVWATTCNLGFNLDAFNDSYLDLTIENCRKGINTLRECNGTSLKILEEGGVAQSGYTSSTIDFARGLTLLSPYFERNVDGPVLTIGANGLCRGVTVTGANVAVSGDAPTVDLNTVPIALDNVDGITFEGSVESGSRHSLWTTTANTKNVNVRAVPNSTTQATEQHAQLVSARNFFPNANFDSWFRGWPRVDVNRATISQETTIIRTGQNGLRLTYNSGQTVAGNVGFVFNDGHVLNDLRGKSVALFAWVWIPNTADWDANDNLTQRNVCSITVGDGVSSSTSTPHHTVRGAWNLMRVEHEVSDSATLIICQLNIGVSSGNTSTGSEFVIFDSVYLIEGQGHDMKVINGQIEDVSNFKKFGDATHTYADAIPSDPDMTYVVGDVVWNDAPTPGGALGWVCTTAGAGGTAQFRVISTIAT